MWIAVLSLCLQTQILPEAKASALPLELNASEYAKQLDAEGGALKTQSAGIEEIIQAGTRMLNWIRFINEQRSHSKKPDQAITITKPVSGSPYPVDDPLIYNETLIVSQYQSALAYVPPQMKQILFSADPFPATLPVNDKIFVQASIGISGAYQMAARFKLNASHLDYYQHIAYRDVRGYFFLKKGGWTGAKLANLVNEDRDTQKLVESWLIQECINTEQSSAVCAETLKLAIANGGIQKWHDYFDGLAQQNWNRFFSIDPNFARKDVQWEDAQMTVPFNTPASVQLQKFLSDNIEDEWKTSVWNLRLQFGNFPSSPGLSFQAGTVPHANAIGGNSIVMDQNIALDEYLTKWTIRHEFGHILGFPDCYFEFYDSSIEAFVSYQLDSTNIMCSRAGHFLPYHFDELKRVYGASTDPK